MSSTNGRPAAVGETRARLSDDELAYYEDTIALTLEIIDRLKPLIINLPADYLDDLLHAVLAASAIRQATILEMHRRKQEAKANRETDCGDISHQGQTRQEPLLRR